MEFFAIPALADVCLLAFTAILILLIRADNSLNTHLKVLYSGLVCISVGLLSVIASLDSRLCAVVMFMVGAFCLRGGWRLYCRIRYAPRAYYRIIK
jgi:hypothetical protein